MNIQSQDNHLVYDSCIIEQGVSLADKNWFGTGGSAAYFIEPTCAQEIKDALRFAREQKKSFVLLGRGANTLISDEGVDGIVIRPQLAHIEHQETDGVVTQVTAGAGVALDGLITYCLSYNLLGLEEFSGIPGTVGGAVYINLHYFEFLLSHFLVRATVFDVVSYEVHEVDNSWFQFGYNQSTLHEGRHILLDATFRLCKGANAPELFYAQGRRDEIIRHREKRYPARGTCGSFFRNFHKDEVDREVNGMKAIWVAYYLDKIGVKGELRVGNAQVSYQHANMIVNLGGATTADIMGVAREMQERVQEAFGIVPQPECRLVGFTEYPLLK